MYVSISKTVPLQKKAKRIFISDVSQYKTFEVILEEFCWSTHPKASHILKIICDMMQKKQPTKEMKGRRIRLMVIFLSESTNSQIFPNYLLTIIYF